MSHSDSDLDLGPLGFQSPCDDLGPLGFQSPSCDEALGPTGFVDEHTLAPVAPVAEAAPVEEPITVAEALVAHTGGAGALACIADWVGRPRGVAQAALLALLRQQPRPEAKNQWDRLR